MKQLFIVILCLTATVRCASNWELIWWDEFDGDSINTTKWQHEVDCWGGGNGELQCYTSRPQNSYIENGNLVLRAIQETYTGTNAGCTNTNGCTGTKSYTSARLRTINDPTGSWKYGRFEMKAQLPNGKHLWPAFWLLPTDNEYGTWAASGEMDIMEYRGQETNIVASTVHYGAAWPNNVYYSSDKVSFNFDFSADFHLFALEWEENEMRYYVDDKVIFTVNTNKMWCANSNCPYTKAGQPWDKRFHMLINLAIGGGFFNGYGDLTTAEAAQWKNSKYVIDYIRVYRNNTDQPVSTTGSNGGGVASTTGPVASTTGPAASTTGSGASTSGSTTGSNNCCNQCCSCSSNNNAAADVAQNSNVDGDSSSVGGTTQSLEDHVKTFTYVAIACVVVSAVMLTVSVVLMTLILKRQGKIQL